MIWQHWRLFVLSAHTRAHNIERQTAFTLSPLLDTGQIQRTEVYGSEIFFTLYTLRFRFQRS